MEEPKDVRKWTVETVAQWASGIIGPTHGQTLKSKEVNGAALLLLIADTRLVVESSGIPLGPALILSDEVKKLTRQSQIVPSPVNPNRFQYGSANFSTVSKGLYFDRTEYIRKVHEAGPYLRFLRPRRFGKSLFVSTLKYFHDFNEKSNFTHLFGNLKIGSSLGSCIPNNFLILFWDLSGISGRSVDEFELYLNNYLNGTIKEFWMKYKQLLTVPIEINENQALMSFQSLISSVKLSSLRIYILIDEYDTSVNEVIKSQNLEMIDYLKKSDGVLPLFRQLFTFVKKADSEGVLGGLFVTGVTPQALNEFTSGFNIARDITFDPVFSDLCGFTKGEVDIAITKYKPTLPLRDHNYQMAKITRNFDGYRFTQSIDRLYNPAIVINYLSNESEPCSDSNVRPSEEILHIIASNPLIKKILPNLFLLKVLQTASIQEKLNVVHLFQPNETDVSYILSYLFFLGALTFHIDDKPSQQSGIFLRIPNRSIEREYLDELKHIYKLSDNEQLDLTNAISCMINGDIGPLCKYLQNHLFFLEQHNDVLHSQESTLKTAFIFAVSISCGSNRVYSEYDIVPNNYLDSFFDIGNGVHIEFKNTTVGQLANRYNRRDWEPMNVFSDDLANFSDEELFRQQLNPNFDNYCQYLNRKMLTVADKWESVQAQAKANRSILLQFRTQSNQRTDFLTYAVYRVGLKRLLWRRIE